MSLRARPHGARLAAALLLSSLVAAACGSALSDEEVLQANGVQQADVATGSGVPRAGSAVGGTAVDAGGDGVGTGDDPAAPGGPSGPADPATPGGAGGDEGAGRPGGPAAAPEDGGTVGTPGETGPIILGSVGNHSGPAGAAQAGFPRALQVWAAAVNAGGGLFGREVQVIVQDDGGDPARYAAAVQDLVENRGVIAFVGQAAVLSARGGVRYLAEKGIPVIGNDCSAPIWFEPSPNMFPQCADAFGQSVTYISSGIEISGKKKFGFVYCGESPACTDNAPIYENESHRAGGETVYSAQISIAQVDFTANCQAAQRAGVELMAVLADPGSLARFVRSCDRQGFKPQYLAISISALPDTVTLPGLSRLVVGVPTFPFAGGSTPAIDEFRRVMDRYLPSDPGPAESAGWAAAKLFELAATKAAVAEGSVNPKSLITALRTVRGETLGGLTVPLDFTSEKPAPAPCAFVLQGDGEGGWTTPLGPGMRCIPGT